MGNFSSLKRKEIYQSITSEPLDLLVIGGGITGAGITLDATVRGLRVSVVEMQDFAAGTSSRSTKLVHGGLRYLKQLEVKMVAEVGKERAVVYENGPHVTTPEWMMLPFYKGGTFGPFTTNIGLRVYDFLAGVKKSERRMMFSKEETLKREPLLKEAGLKGAGYYVEYKTDDARLTLEVVKKAVEKGANAINYAKVIDFIYNKGSIRGVIVEDQLSKEQYRIYANRIINATGPWVDQLREIDKSKEGKQLHLTKGDHLVFDQFKFPLKQAIYFDTPDKRMVFAIPRDGKTYVGTTDTTYKGNTLHPKLTSEDRSYLLAAVNEMFPSIKVTNADIESSWAGLRPLIHEEGKDPSEISRKDEIFVSKSSLISIAGGKLTGYRKMSEEVVNLVAKQLNDRFQMSVPRSQTKHLPISGGDVGGSGGFPSFIAKKVNEGVQIGLSEEDAYRVTKLYGSNVEAIFEYYQSLQTVSEEEGIPPLLLAQLYYGIEEEMVVKPEDFFVRRTGALFFDIDLVESYRETITNYMAKYFERIGYSLEREAEKLELLMKEAKA